ncbi:HalOD1 output domain-containing protein [Haloarcula marina]|uniref:HalOD1 output domain-containing protein n=1 Tax=Haloarcula marina TaxID=2961574 RepID=UPI0020B64604|nr:HalOD1 output domain-containing protein [Halomicroarcula marina]
MREVKLQAHSNTTGSVASRVIDAVCSRTGTSATDLPPLYETIDTDALNELFADRHTSGRVTFDYAGHVVTVRGDQTVEVSARTEHR